MLDNALRGAIAPPSNDWMYLSCDTNLEKESFDIKCIFQVLCHGQASYVTWKVTKSVSCDIKTENFCERSGGMTKLSWATDHYTAKISKVAARVTRFLLTKSFNCDMFGYFGIEVSSCLDETEEHSLEVMFAGIYLQDLGVRGGVGVCVRAVGSESTGAGRGK